MFVKCSSQSEADQVAAKIARACPDAEVTIQVRGDDYLLVASAEGSRSLLPKAPHRKPTKGSVDVN